MKYLGPVTKLMVWVVLMTAFLHFFTLSTDNSLSLQPDWFSGDQNDRGNGIYTLVNYSNPGFPIQIDGSSTEGPYWLAWAINITTAVIVGVIFAIILHKLRYKKF